MGVVSKIVEEIDKSDLLDYYSSFLLGRKTGLRVQKYARHRPLWHILAPSLAEKQG